MKIVYFSKGPRGNTCLNEVLRNGHAVKAVVAGGQDAVVKKICENNGLTLLIQDNPNTAEFAELLASFGAELFVCSGYNKILKPFIFNIPPLGTINLHGGRLPFYRGTAPINWQIINGEGVGGCCILFMDEGIDTGPIISQELYEIGVNDTHQSVLDKTLIIFPRLLVKVLRDFELHDIHAVGQNPEDGCYYTRRYPEDSRINWQTMTDAHIHNLVRGMQGPFPHAFTFRRSEKIEIEQTALLREEIRGVSGRVSLKRREGAVVLCKNRGLLIKEIRIEGQVLNACHGLKLGEKLE